MTPRFAPDLTEHRATTRIFERGEYEIELKKPTARIYEKDDGTEVAVVTYFATMRGKVKGDGSLDDEFDGEDVSPIRCYLHSDGAMRMTKQFLLAAFGYGRNDEDQFNEEVAREHDFSLDGEEGEEVLGAGWSECVGNRVRTSLDIEEYEGREQQRFATFMPVN